MQTQPPLASPPMPLATILFLAWRNLWRRRRRTFITLASISIGFSLAVCFIGLSDGGHNQMIRNGIRMGDGHLTVQRTGYKENPLNDVFIADGKALEAKLKAALPHGTIAPRVNLQVLASTAANAVGVEMNAIHPAHDPLTANLSGNLVAGKWIQPGDLQGVVVGWRMAEKLNAKVGSKIVFMAGSSNGESTSQLGRVRGIFKAGVDELDSYLVVAPIQMGWVFLGHAGADTAKEPVTRFAVFLENENQTGQAKAALQAQELPPQVAVLGWQEMMPQLVSFILLDEMADYVGVFFILVMVAFGILNTMMMSVLERTREFGLLQALGIGRGAMVWMVLFETFWLSLAALGAGWFLGGSLHLYLAIYGLDLSAVFGEGFSTAGTVLDPLVFSELSLGRVAWLTSSIVAITLFSGLYPAWRAWRVSPLRSIQT